MSKINPLQLTILFFLLITILFNSYPAKADFSSDYQDYLKLYDSYREKHAAYLTTRNQYLTYGTLTAKNRAIAAVIDIMLARDDVLLQYYGLLRQKYTTYTVYQPLLDADEKFVSEHKPVINPVADLDDAVKISEKLEKQHIPMQINSRKIVGAILYAKVENLKNEVIQAEFTAQNIINTLKAENKDVSVLERWLIDAQSKRSQAELKQREIEAMISGLSATNLDNLSKNYNTLVFSVAETNQYLKEAMSFLNELKETIKYGEY